MDLIVSSLIFILPIWIYLWLDNSVKLRLSYYLDLVCFVPKRWWALKSISSKKKRKNKKNIRMHTFKRLLKPHVDDPKLIMDENSSDSVSFYGTDQNGNSLFVKMCHRGHHAAEVGLQLILKDGRTYTLPNYPHTVTEKGLRRTARKWSASDLNIEILEPRQRWRITYNGFLRNQSKGDDTTTDGNLEHVRLNLIFIGHSRPLEWPDDWSTQLHADALASEPWKSPDWMNKVKLLDYTGFDQYGSVIGQITFNDSSTSALYLQGLSQRRWGKHESYQFRRMVTFLGVTKQGALYYLGASNTKHSFSHMQFGHLEAVGGKVSKIDWTDFKLEEFYKGNTVPMNYKIAFIADGKQYNIAVNYIGGNEAIYYNGQPRNWTCTTRNFDAEVNGRNGLRWQGVGQVMVCCPYTGPHTNVTSPVESNPSARIQHLIRPIASAQKDTYVLQFTDNQCQNEGLVGGKGYSLAVLTSVSKKDDETNKFVVPEGFCVTTLALEHQLQHTELKHLIADIVDISCGKKKDDLKDYCEKAVSVIQNIPVKEQIEKVILESLEKLESPASEKRHRYAVRSSAVGEDSDETSAAGQNSTYLGVKGANEVVKGVANCWASLFSYRSVEYRRQNGLPVKASMGVCVQKMVDAEAAGVMFTRDPMTGDPSNIVISANYGLGETVVSGKVEPDTVTIHRKWDNTLTLDDRGIKPGSKGQKMSMSDEGVTTSDVSEEETKEISISRATALRLAEIGLQLESLFGSARDVEWAVVGEQIFLLQARPITSLNAWTDFELTHELDTRVPSDVDLITFANIGEVLPYPVSPLTISTVQKILNVSLSVRFNTYDLKILYAIGMRCAINYIDSALRDVGTEITMFNKMIDLALSGHIVTTPKVHKVAIEKFGVASDWRQIYLLFDLIKLVWTKDRLAKQVTTVYNKYTLDANKFSTACSLHNEISNKYEEIFLLGKYHNVLSLVSVCTQVFAMHLITNGNIDFTSDHLADIAVLLSSCTNVISTEVPIALDEIATCIRRTGKAEKFSKVEPAQAVAWLKSNCPAAAEKLQTFFDTHGHRCVQEMDLFMEPWVLRPDSIISTIQALTTSCENKKEHKTLSVQDTIASLRTPMTSFKKRILSMVIPLFRKAVTHRELTKNATIAAVHVLRLAYRRLGRLMVSEGYIPDERLVFFLTHPEIGQLLNNDDNPLATRALLVRKALRRRKIYSQVAELEYPEFTTGMPMPIQKTLDISSYKGCTKIEGTSVCGGFVLGRACVITDLVEAESIKYGDILITHCTDIGWSPYFPLLKGIVTELGGLISHGAVVAREYGLPCIVGAKHATQVFRTGDSVLLNGDTGVLQLIEENKES